MYFGMRLKYSPSPGRENPEFLRIFGGKLEKISRNNMADEKIIFSMVGVSKTFTHQKRVLNNIYLSFFYGAKIDISGLHGG